MIEAQVKFSPLTFLTLKGLSVASSKSVRCALALRRPSKIMGHLVRVEGAWGLGLPGSAEVKVKRARSASALTGNSILEDVIELRSATTSKMPLRERAANIY